MVRSYRSFILSFVLLMLCVLLGVIIGIQRKSRHEFCSLRHRLVIRPSTSTRPSTQVPFRIDHQPGQQSHTSEETEPSTTEPDIDFLKTTTAVINDVVQVLTNSTALHLANGSIASHLIN